MHGGVRAAWLAVCLAICAACGQPAASNPGAASSSAPRTRLSIAPGKASLLPAGTVQFTANDAVLWSVQEGDAGGIVDSSGRYTAPATPGLYHVVATRVTEPHDNLSAEVTVAPPPVVDVAIDPPSASLDSGGTVQFAARVSGAADSAVVWTADAGFVDQTGRYTAPAAGGTFQIVATSRANPAASATAIVVVSSALVAVSPSTVALAFDATQRFTAQVSRAADPRVLWSIVEGPAGGSIDSTGLYTPPPSPGTFHVVAVNVADPTSFDTATVTVTPPPGVWVSLVPRNLIVSPGVPVRLTATVFGASDTRVIWSCDAGSIRQDGLYSAPRVEGTYHVTARSLADPSRLAVATLTVQSAAVTLPVEPDHVAVEVEGLVVFRANLPGTADGDVIWSIQEGAAGGSIDALGQYIAPADHEGVYHVVATSRLNPAVTGTATVTVQRFDLVDHGGSVAPSTRTFALWWGDAHAFPVDARPLLETLLNGLNGSTYFAIANEYLRGATATTSFAGNLFDPTMPPADNPAEATIGAKACGALVANGIANQTGDVVFVLSSVFPAGPVPFCAWHYWDICNGQPLLIVYLPNPTGTACGRQASGCNAYSPEATALGTFAAHELMETITDPFVTAWKDQPGEEIGDKCFGLAACVPLSTGILQLQPLYSNAAHACVHP